MSGASALGLRPQVPASDPGESGEGPGGEPGARKPVAADRMGQITTQKTDTYPFEIPNKGNDIDIIIDVK